MDTATLTINICALTFSLLATVISTTIARRQSRMMEQANLLPIMTEILGEFRIPEFRIHRDYVVTRLWLECPSEENGFTRLPDEAKSHVYAVAGFFNTVGALVANGMISSLAVSSYMGGSALRTWEKLEPYIRHERRIRPDENYHAFFEHLICLLKDAPPPVIDRRLGLRRLPASQQRYTVPAAGTTAEPEG